MEQPLQRFLDSVNDALPVAPEAARDEAAPVVPFKSSLLLNRSQEETLVEHALKRLQELESEMGRTETGKTNWFSSMETSQQAVETARSHFGKRQLYEMTFHNQMQWRPGVLGGIFRDSNLIVPISRRVVRQMVARANNYFFGTDPWFSCYPVGASDKPEAERVDRYTRHKLDQAGAKSALETAVELAFIRGECVVKTTHKRREDIYKKQTRILVNQAGAPILDATGDYIEETDLFVAQKAPVMDPQTGQPAVDPQTGDPIMQETGQFVLKRDGQTPLPSPAIYQDQLITRRIVLYEGPDTQPVYYRDFLAPLDAPTIQEADICIHLYDMPVGVLADMYRRRGLLKEEGANPEATKAAIELIRNMAHESGEPKAARDQARLELSEDERRTERTTIPVAEIAECWLRFDCDGDGIEEQVMLVIDRKNRRPIFYDYTANVSPDGQRPFDVVRASKVDGRWFGIGPMEMFESSQVIIDLLVNRWNFSQSRAGRIDLWRPYNTLEGDRDPNLKLNWGSTYTPKPGMKAEDVIETVNLNDIKHEALQNMFEFFLQIVMNESGVQHANDAAAMGLDQAKLATGIRNIEKSGQEMFALFLSTLEPGLQDAVRRAMQTLFFNLNAEEAFVFYEGDTAQVDQIRPEEVREMDLDVQLMLTRYRGEQQLQSNTQAANLTVQFYGMPPEIQGRVAPLYRDMLKALQVSNADAIIIPGAAMTNAPGMAPTAPGMPVPNEPGKSEPLL